MPRAGFHDQKLDPSLRRHPLLIVVLLPPLSHCPGQATGDHPDLLPSRQREKEYNDYDDAGRQRDDYYNDADLRWT